MPPNSIDEGDLVMEHKKIFIVEDEIRICKGLVALLESEGYEADYLKNFEHTAEDIVAAGADLVLLDINLPGINGEMVLRELRRKSEVPVIMVTSKTGESDELISMSYGADDYITKPYNPLLLLLRVQAVLKRSAGSGANTGTGIVEYRDCEVNFDRGVITPSAAPDARISLTKNEMIIFKLLYDQMDKIVSRDQIMTVLWDNEEYINDNALTVNISRLRTKLGELGYGDAIETKKKLGYILLSESQGKDK